MEANPYDPPLSVPEPQKPTVRLTREGDAVRLVNSKRQWGIAAFLLFWLAGWTLGCIALVFAVITQFSFFMLLFAVPFWAAEIFVGAIVGTMIASREEFVLDGDGARYRWTIWGLPVKRRIVPLAEITSFKSRLIAAGDANAMKGNRHVVAMETIGLPLDIGGGETEEERNWVASELNDALATLRRYQGPIERTTEGSPGPLSINDLPPVLELRPPSSTTVSAPSDTTWRQRYDFDAITFTQRGRLALSSVGFLLFINAFWNGITGLFVAGLFGFSPDGQQQGFQGWEWFGMFLFLIPFELIGLVMFCGLLAVLAEPVRRSKWILHRNAVAYRISWLGIGRTWRYEVEELDRLELRRATTDAEEETEEEEEDSDVAPSAITSSDDNNEPAPNTLTLALVDTQGQDLCTIAGLSLGEACWIADVILREHSGWFR